MTDDDDERAYQEVKTALDDACLLVPPRVYHIFREYARTTATFRLGQPDAEPIEDFAVYFRGLAAEYLLHFQDTEGGVH